MLGKLETRKEVGKRVRSIRVEPRLIASMPSLQMRFQMVFVLESSSAKDATELRLDSAFQPTVLLQRLLPFVHLAAVVAGKLFKQS